MSRSLAIVLLGGATLLACKAPTGEEGPVGSDGVGPPGQQGAAAERTPTLTSLSPQRVFLGRQVEVLISGTDTNWSPSSALEFDFGPGVETVSFTVASPTAVVATIDVQDEAVLGLRTVRVRDGAAEAASVQEFAVDPSMEVSPGATNAQDVQNFRRPFQGSIIQGFFDQLDESTPFDPIPAHREVSIGGGSSAVSDVNTGKQAGLDLSVWISIDVFAEPGPRRISIESGPPGATVRSVTAYEPIDIEPRTPTPLAVGSNPGVWGVPGSSRLYSVETGGESKLLTFTISGEEALADVVILPPSGKFSEALRRVTKRASDRVVAHTIVPAGFDEVFLVYWSWGQASGYEFDIALQEQLTSTITLLTAPFVAGEIEEVGESDWFRFEGEGGTQVHVEIESSGAEPCGSNAVPGGIDSEIELVDESGVSLAFNDDLGGNFCSGFDIELLATGTYYVRVASSARFAPNDTFAYQLAFAEL